MLWYLWFWDQSGYTDGNCEWSAVTHTIVEGWSRPQVLIPENSHAVFKVASAKNRYEAIHLECESTTPTHSQQWAHQTTRHFLTIQWPFVIFSSNKIINSSKFIINSFSFFWKCKHLSLILSLVVFWSLFFRCLGVYGASLKNSKSFLAICNANLQMPHVGLCWRTRWDDIETHWMHDEIHSSLHKTCKWKWIKINCMTHRSLETNELPEEWCQLVGGTVCAEVQHEENQIFAAKSGGMAAGGGKIVNWHAEMTWRVSHFWENMLEQTC